MKEIKDDLGNDIQEINNLLSERVPSYEKLQLAYIIANKHGFFSNYIEKQLALQPANVETQIMCAERIELFLANK